MSSYTPIDDADQQDLADLKRYDVETPIARGATGMVFTARERLSRRLPVDRRVALKVVRHQFLEQARTEATKLMSLDQIRGVVNIMRYFEVPLGTLETQFSDNPVVQRFFSDDIRDESVGVLVLQYVAGTPLVSRVMPHDPDHRSEDKDYFVVRDFDTGVWLQEELRYKLSVEDKLDILIQMTRHIEQCHKQGAFHGDLKPLNVLYDINLKEVRIVDFQDGVSGSPGWQAPEHSDGSLAGPKMDIFVLGLFITRFFETDGNRQLAELADACLQRDPSERPGAGAVLDRLTRIQKAILNPKFGLYGRLLASISLVIILALAATLYWSTRPELLADRFAKDFGKAYLTELTKNSMEYSRGRKAVEEINDLIEQNRQQDFDIRFKQQLVQALARLRTMNKNRPLTTLPKVFTDVKALWFEPMGREFVYWHQGWLKQGEWITQDHYFDGLIIPQNETDYDPEKPFLIRFRDREGHETLIPIDARVGANNFWPVSEDPTIFFFNARLSPFIDLLAELEGRRFELEDASVDEIPVNGTLSFRDRASFISSLCGFLPVVEDGDRLVLNKARDRNYYMLGMGQIDGKFPLLSFIDSMEQVTGTSLTDPDMRALLEGKEAFIRHTGESASLPWQLALREMLGQFQLDFRVNAEKQIILEELNP